MRSCLSRSGLDKLRQQAATLTSLDRLSEALRVAVGIVRISDLLFEMAGSRSAHLGLTQDMISACVTCLLDVLVKRDAPCVAQHLAPFAGPQYIQRRDNRVRSTWTWRAAYIVMRVAGRLACSRHVVAGLQGI
jgi:hypothetical protein